MNEHEIESIRLKLGSALIHLARARRRHSRDEDLARAKDALEHASAMLPRPIDEESYERA